MRSRVTRGGEKRGLRAQRPGISVETRCDSRSTEPAGWKEGGLGKRARKRKSLQGKEGLRKFRRAPNRGGIQALLAEQI